MALFVQLVGWKLKIYFAKQSYTYSENSIMGGFDEMQVREVAESEGFQQVLKIVL